MTDTAAAPEPAEAEPPAVEESEPEVTDTASPEAAEPEVVEAPEPLPEQPEPVIVGHGVVQDNVSEPGQYVTRLPDGTETGRHDVTDATPQAVSETPEG